MPRPVIETLATGDEVVNGDIVDGNAAYASRQLAGRGLLVTRHTALPDDTVALEAGIREIGARASLCVVSGGLGPTEDDLTPDVVARILGVPLEVDAEALGGWKSASPGRATASPPTTCAAYRCPPGPRCFRTRPAPPGIHRNDRRVPLLLPARSPHGVPLLRDAHLLPRVGRLWPEGSEPSSS